MRCIARRRRSCRAFCSSPSLLFEPLLTSSSFAELVDFPFTRRLLFLPLAQSTDSVSFSIASNGLLTVQRRHRFRRLGSRARKSCDDARSKISSQTASSFAAFFLVFLADVFLLPSFALQHSQVISTPSTVVFVCSATPRDVFFRSSTPTMTSQLAFRNTSHSFARELYGEPQRTVRRQRRDSDPLLYILTAFATFLLAMLRGALFLSFAVSLRTSLTCFLHALAPPQNLRIRRSADEGAFS
jgi:hypothetical protein